MPDASAGSIFWPIPNGDVSVAFLVGHRVAGIDSAGAPGSWIFDFDNRCRLTVEGTWRIIKDGLIVIGGNDHHQMFGLTEPVDAASKARDAIGSGVITAASCAEVTGDLVLQFDSGARLDVLVDSSGYESWQLSKPDGTTVVAAGGGKVTLFGRRAG